MSPFSLRRGRLGACLTVVFAFCSAFAWADVTAEQRKQVNELYPQMRQAAALYTQEKYEESGDIVADVQKQLKALSDGADSDLLTMLEQAYRRVVRAHALLELEGIELLPLEELMSKPAAEPSPADGVSFVKQVVPILVKKCGRCHIDADRGGFSLADYSSLLRGSSAGMVIFPKDADGSRMVELIAMGDMPRGGLKLSADELASVKNWIAEGARFDGDDPHTNLRDFALGSKDRRPANATKTAGQGTVSFAREIAPILVSNCSGCHVGARRARGGLNMTTFTGLLRGGDNGAPIFPRRPSASLLVQKLEGSADGQRMPAGRDPLSDTTLAKVKEWISQGAGFDGPDADQNLREVAAIATAQAATHEELSVRRADLAEENWRLGMPNITADRFETECFLFLGNVGEETLKDLGQRAEALTPRVAAFLDAASDEPLIKGRMAIYVFSQRYDYSEFGHMVEKRELPKTRRGHWRFSIVDAYGALVLPKDGDTTFEGLFAQLLAGTYVASLSAPPRWFAEGSGRVIAARIAAKDTRVRQWERELTRIVAAMAKSDDFLTGKIPQEEADIASYGFVKFLMNDSRRYRRLLSTLGRGEGFPAAFQAIYGGTPSQATQLWVRSLARDGRRR